MTAVTSKRSRMEDSGGFTDFPKEAVEVVGPAWKVVGPDLQKGFNAVKEKLNKGELFFIPVSWWCTIEIVRKHATCPCLCCKIFIIWIFEFKLSHHDRETKRFSAVFSYWYNRTVDGRLARLCSSRVCFQNIYEGETNGSFSRLTVILASLYQIFTVDKGII